MVMMTTTLFMKREKARMEKKSEMKRVQPLVVLNLLCR